MKSQYLKILAMVFAVLASEFISAQCNVPITYLSDNNCQGNTYTNYGFNLVTNTSGLVNYYDTILVTAGPSAGCDSIVALQLTVYPILYTNIYDTICQGGSFLFNGTTYTTAGIYGDTLFYGSNFCDSVILLNLAIRPSHNDTFRISATSCGGGGTFGGGGYNFYGTNERTSGIYVHIGGAVPGGGTCADSVVILTLTVGAPVVTIGRAPGGGGGPGGTPDTVRTCSSNYDFYGRTLTTDGNYADTVVSSIGCDSIIAYITLELNSGYNSALVNGTSCAGAPFVWRGISYPGPTGGGGGGGGTVSYYDTIIVSGGCDTIYTITVARGMAPRPVNVVDSFCAGSSFTYGGSTFITAGTDTVYVPAPTGCDSTIILHLFYKAAPTYLWVDSFCEGSSYTYRGHTYIDSGAHYFTVPAPGGGCDSIIEVFLGYKSAPTINLVDSFCQGMSYTYRGVTYTTAGVHAITITAPTGCDSVINLNLSYTTPPGRTIVDTICQGTSFIYGTDTFTTRGVHTFLVTNSGMCDSLITLDLTLTPEPRAFIRDSFCAGTTYYYGSDSFTAAGTYTILVPASIGCDTNLTLFLTNKVGPATPVITATGTTLIVNPAAASYQWYLNGTAIPGATAQVYVVTQSGVYSVITQGTGSCAGISANYTVTGVGISNVSGSDMFKLYPNPNNGKFTIESAQFAGTDITIYDVLGRVVYQKQLLSATESIDMSNTLNGTYYLVMKNQQFTRYAHFVIAQ